MMKPKYFNMKQPELGKKLAEIRRQKGLTQEELVDLCNVSVRTIQRIETGEVTPRSYTVKAILAAMEVEVDSLQTEEPKKGLPWIHAAWVSGILYFILGFPESSMDTVRFFQSDFVSGFVSGLDHIPKPDMDFDHNWYFAVKLLVLLTFIFFMKGFIDTGNYFKVGLLKITCVFLIAATTFSVLFDMYSLSFPSSIEMIVVPGVSIMFGILGLLFGASLIQLNRPVGVVCVFAGGLEIFASLFFLIINPIGLIIQIPATILEIIILYQVTQIKERNELQLTK